MSDCAWSVSPLLALSLIVIISSSVCFLLMFCAFSGQPDRLDKYNSQTLLTAQTVHGRAKRCNTGNSEQKKRRKPSSSHLLWVANTLLACPRPLQPGRGQWGSSCLLVFQGNGRPLIDDSFCLLAASGQLPALRWDVYFPDMWPCPSQPITGHLTRKTTGKKQSETLQCLHRRNHYLM